MSKAKILKLGMMFLATICIYTASFYLGYVAKNAFNIVFTDADKKAVTVSE